MLSVCPVSRTERLKCENGSWVKCPSELFTRSENRGRGKPRERTSLVTRSRTCDGATSAIGWRHWIRPQNGSSPRNRCRTLIGASCGASPHQSACILILRNVSSQMYTCAATLRGNTTKTSTSLADSVGFPLSVCTLSRSSQACRDNPQLKYHFLAETVKRCRFG